MVQFTGHRRCPNMLSRGDYDRCMAKKKTQSAKIPPKAEPKEVEKSPATDSEKKSDGLQDCPVVGFGASAGGLEAFTELLQNIPENPGFALVLVQHLDPKHASILTQLLSRSAKLPVLQAKESLRVQQGHVYVIPPNSDLSISNGVLHLTRREPAGQHMPIDSFFRSLAHDQGSKAIGVILSGTASDGTLGLKAIKAEGGI